ncbi:MAG: Uma2 family endonuclease [Bacteroidota bacterium]
MKDVLDIPRTAMEVFEMLPEGTLCEVIDNALYMSPSPTTDHQDILGEIFLEIATACKKNRYGKVLLSPCDVYLDNGESVVQPDLLFIKEARRAIIEKKGIIGSPDFVIEILSTNLKFDKETKLQLYQRNSIPEYFIIDPETKSVLHYLLVDDAYQLQENKPVGQLYIKQLDLQVNF